MKRISKLLMVSASFLVLAGCSKTAPESTFTELDDDETLFVGDNYRFKNNVTVDEGAVYQDYDAYIVYTLGRSSYQQGNNDVYYGGYYYRWNTNKTQDSALLGNRKITTITTYEYMPYTKDEFVVVRTKVVTQYEYGYESGVRSFHRSLSYELNGYFSSLSNLQTNCEELYKKIDHSSTEKIYVVATPRTITQTSTQNYNTYFFIEEE